jgi:enamine deaminase RidA (YjgF/YER057c/UK114 family)
MDHMLAQAERICRKAGTSLANAVRIQQFHTDLAGFEAAAQAWHKHLPGQHLPFSAIEVPALCRSGRGRDARPVGLRSLKGVEMKKLFATLVLVAAPLLS